MSQRDFVLDATIGFVTVARAPVSSVRLGPVVALIAANLVPLAGVLFFGWSLFELVLVYWLENGVIGAYNLLRMAGAGGGQPTVSERVGRMAFFAVHYGIFWIIHGVFVIALFGAGVSFGPPLMVDPISGGVKAAILSLVVSHGVSFVQNYLVGRERSHATLEGLMAQPYARVAILHLTILGGGFAAAYLGSPGWALLIMVVLKIGVDVASHLREHRAALVAPTRRTGRTS